MDIVRPVYTGHNALLLAHVSLGSRLLLVDVWLFGGCTLVPTDYVEPEVLVLLSGGIDSTACLNFYLELERNPSGLFVDYGQRAAAQEWHAASKVASHYGVSVTRLRCQGGRSKEAGLISGRNAFLITAALLEKPPSVSAIATGIHSGTGYADCSPEFMRNMQVLLSMYQEAQVQLAAPFLDWTKIEIIKYCSMSGVPIDLTYSCEGGPEPCGDCMSCQDRKLLDVSA